MELPHQAKREGKLIPLYIYRALTRQARLQNLRKAFAIRQPENLRGKRILLVDDVFTTGTTLHECAKTLRQAGSGPVFALTLARTLDADLVPDRLLAEQATGLPGIGWG